MAVANLSWILAANGLRVLNVDWDLESPALHRFFRPFLEDDAVSDVPGIVDMVRDYERAASRVSERGELGTLIRDRARIKTYTIPIDWEFPDGGKLDFVSAGRQSIDYADRLASLNWKSFYELLNGSEFLDAIRDDLKKNYDYVLIDSGHGMRDTASICTVQLPDILVNCFTLSTHGIEGAAQVARLIEQRHKHRNIRILPVPMRVDPSQKEKVDKGYQLAFQLFSSLPSGMSERERREYRNDVSIPYMAYYAYEEILAIFGDPPGFRYGLLASYERMAAHLTSGAVTSLPPMHDQLRNRTILLFARKVPWAGSN